MQLIQNEGVGEKTKWLLSKSTTGEKKKKKKKVESLFSNTGKFADCVTALNIFVHVNRNYNKIYQQSDCW